MATTILYDPITNPDPTAQGYLTYGQLPLSPLFIAEFPPANVADITDVFEVDELPQSTSASGVNLDTNGTFFDGLVGYNPAAYYLSNGATKIPTGNTFAANNSTGYAGFTNYSIDIDLENIDLSNLDIEDFIGDVELSAVNSQFPKLDAEKGFTLTFDLEINEELSDINRAGFSLIVISNDRTKGIEIGFKEEGTNSDRVFAQNANLNATNTAGEDSSASLEIKNTNQYSLTFSDNGYQLKANNTLLLQGALRDYSFDPTNSEPPFPTSVNPYETPNFVFFGDNTDQGYADLTLGRISVDVEDTSPPVVPPTPPTFQPAQPDFNDDQRADLVWRNVKTGSNILWYMDEATVKGTASLGSVSANWQLEGMGDFDKNGTSDLVWRNVETGSNVLWYMNGAQVTGTASLGSVRNNWHIEAVEDFDKNGSADLVWRNYANGQNVLWSMDGTTVKRTDSLGSVPNLNWQIEGAGDLDDDGDIELIWRNYANGQNLFWSMDGANIVQTGLIAEVTSPNWHIEGIADYDNNGTADLVWRNQANGSNTLWKMNGSTIEGTASIGTVAGADWQIVVG
ncbi:MAG: hypothetical protein AAGF01_10010 [Cyanobacteria bacterium P01_G01_bin.38]